MGPRYALVRPETGLVIREAALKVLRREVDPYGGDAFGFVIHRASGSSAGMRGLIADTAMPAKDRYPPITSRVG